jgi:hypothetical protein
MTAAALPQSRTEASVSRSHSTRSELVEGVAQKARESGATICDGTALLNTAVVDNRVQIALLVQAAGEH